MTESSFPFEGQPAPAFEDDSASGGGRSKLVLAGTLAAVVLGAGGWFLLGSGGDAEDDFALPAPKPAAASPQEAAPAPIEVVPAAATEAVGRNPFKPRYVAPAASSAGTTTEGTPTGTGTGATSGTTTGGTSTTGGSTTTGGTTTTGTTTTGGTSTGVVKEQPQEAPKYISVVSVDAADNQVTFKSVDRNAAKPEDREQVHVVKPGETFATYFKLFGYGSVLDAQGQPRDCTDLLYGDARIKLCVGESYQVS